MVNELVTRITIDPDVLVGKSVIKGTRVSVEHILDLLANGWTGEKILENYPQLLDGDVKLALRYASDLMMDERVYSYP